MAQRLIVRSTAVGSFLLRGEGIFAVLRSPNKIEQC